MAAEPQPLVVKPVNVVEGPGITISEFFGRVASKDSTTSIAVATVKRPDEAAFQAPQFSEYVICDEGVVELVETDGTRIRVGAGEGVFLPKGHRVKWTWPEPARYTAVCLPAFSPELAAAEVDDPSCTAVDAESRQKLAALHDGAASAPAPSSPSEGESGKQLKAVVFKPVDVVQAPGITISEHFGHVSSCDGAASLAKAVVTRASEEAFQAPQFDEYVICTEGSIEFRYGGSGGDEHCARIAAGEGVFLPKGLRVKWVWPEPTRYTVLCLLAFSPELSGREAEEGSTVAKDSESMKKLEELHKGVKAMDLNTEQIAGA